MVELSEHLLDLIFRQKSATVPDLGTFKFEFKNAKMDFANSTILPPSQILTFSESTSEINQLSFRDFLIREKGFDPYEAGIKVKAFTHQIKNTIRQLGYCYLPGIGTLHQEGETHLRFAPGDRIKALKPTLGLPEIPILPIEREFVKTANNIEIEAETFVDTRSERVSSERNKWVLPAVLTFVAVGLGLIGLYYYRTNFGINPDINSDTLLTKQHINEDSILLTQHGFLDSSLVKSDVTDSVIDKQAIIDEIESSQPAIELQPESTDPNLTLNKAEKKVDEQLITKKETQSNTKKETPAIAKKTEPTVAEPESTEGLLKEKPKQSGCAVIVGAMANKSNALKLAKRLEKSGYTPYSYYSKGLTKVGAACDCDESSLNKMLAAMKKLDSNAWVYKIK